VIDSFVVAGVCLLAGALVPVSPGPVSLAVCALLAIGWPRLRPISIAAGIVLFALGAWRSASALAAFDASRNATRAALGPPSLCSGTVVVASSPVRVRDSTMFFAEARAMECEQGRVEPGTVLRLYAADDDLGRGDACFVIATLGVVEIPRNEELDTLQSCGARTGATLSGGALDVRVQSRARWSAAWWVDRARMLARRRIEATYPADAAPMARALVLGESDLDDADTEAFRISGLSHILAVSGTHIVIAVFGIVSLLRGLLVRVERWSARFDVGRVAAAAGVPIAWAYAEFAGSGGSVRRAAVMATAALLARALARNPDGLRAFGLSLAAGGLLDPLAVFDFSFGLSAAATAGLLALSRPFEAALRKLPVPIRWGATPMATTLSATLACAPWLVLLSSQLSPVGIAANIIAVPIGEAISLPACLGHLLLSPLPSAERGVALLASASLLAVRAVARLGASLSGASIALPRPTGWHLAILAIAAGYIALRRPRDKLLIVSLSAVALVVAELVTVRAGQPRGRLRVTIVDVGQGDSVLVDLPDGRAMLIDGGGAVGSPVDPGRTVLTPLLRARRRSRVDIGVLSHPHPDHFIGLASALPRVDVGQFWDNGQGERHDAGPQYRALLSNLRARGVPILRPGSLCGRSLAAGAALVQVLEPCPDLSAGENANDNSLVLRVSMGRRAALLVGDAEYEEESRLIAHHPGLLRADLLKVGHHGSRTSSSVDFLDAVNPSVAVISCGVRNRFGHPHPNTLDHLASRGIRVLRTDQVGGVRWETDGEEVSVVTTVKRN
jgi:competence protein ComEC